MKTWLRNNSLWLIGSGLMLASAGIDGAYMARWTIVPVLGYILNATADICSEVLMYWYGRFQQDRSDRKRRLSAALLAAEVIAVGYSWLFSWRQLRPIFMLIEPADWRWLAPLAAGFIPLLLSFVGYAQSLLVGRIAQEPLPQRIAVAQPSLELAEPSFEPEQPPLEPSEPAAALFRCKKCDFERPTQEAINAHQKAHRANGGEHGR